MLARLLVPLLGLERSLFIGLGVGLALEAVQALAVGKILWLESAYDTAVNGFALLLGLASASPGRTAHRLGAWLHPLVVGPMALFGFGWITLGRPHRAAALVALVLITFLPAILLWGMGVASGRFHSAQVPDARRRVPLFAMVTLGASLATPVVGIWWPGPLRYAIGGMALCAGLYTLAAAGGFRMSGHVGTPLLGAVALAPWSPRGAALLVGIGALLTWARVRTGRHRPVEVAAAWLLAAIVAIGVGVLR